MLAEHGVIDVESLPPYLRHHVNDASPEKSLFECSELIPLSELDRRYAGVVLEQVKHNKAKAAEILGISRPRLYRLLRSGATENGIKDTMSKRQAKESLHHEANSVGVN